MLARLRIFGLPMARSKSHTLHLYLAIGIIGAAGWVVLEMWLFPVDWERQPWFARVGPFVVVTVSGLASALTPDRLRLRLKQPLSTGDAFLAVCVVVFTVFAFVALLASLR